MTKEARQILLGLILAFGLNHLILGLFWLPSYSHSGPVLLAFALYLIALVFSLYGHDDLIIPRIQAYLNLAVCLVIPVLVLNELPIRSYSTSGSYQTWFIAGISLVLAITSVRGYPALGWVGLVYLWFMVVTWGGVGVVTTAGLIGALLIVLTAWALGRGLRSTEAAAAEYHRQASALQTQAAENVASREARQSIIQNVLLTGLPLLERIRDQAGELGDADRNEAVLLEQRFRDEIQGRNLLNDGVRLAARDARKRGVTVTFEDAGGMNGLSESEIQGILSSVIQAITATASGKILISAPANESYRVSIIAQRPEADRPDLWQRLP